MKEEIPIECYVTREGNLVKFVRYEKIQELQEEIKRLKEEYMILQNASDEVEEEKDREIERLNKRIEDLSIINEEHKILNEMIRKELQQKENIIKEVREYCINRSQYFNEARIEQYPFSREEEYSIENILEILDKVDKENI